MPESLSRRISSFVHTRCGGDVVEVPQEHPIGERKVQQFQLVALTTLCQIETAVLKERLYGALSAGHRRRAKIAI
jgi:hypothetical protein